MSAIDELSELPEKITDFWKKQEIDLDKTYDELNKKLDEFHEAKKFDDNLKSLTEVLYICLKLSAHDKIIGTFIFGAIMNRQSDSTQLINLISLKERFEKDLEK